MHFIVFSHLRWDFVYQRPQHLLSRCAQKHMVWFWEEPIHHEGISPRLNVSRRSDSLTVITPELPPDIGEPDTLRALRHLLLDFVAEHEIRNPVLWYYTPMARNFTRDLIPIATVYDCMDELSAFRGAPPGLRAAETELFNAADLVFTGGRSLYESKRHQHHSVHCFPSSIDTKHFGLARAISADPMDQAWIPHPRIGFCGVIDERMDIGLVAGIAERRPDWHLAMIGPVVKISESELPAAENIHYLGSKSYDELPRYMAGWDAAILPFARNESTKFISPTKTPEYLAAGLPVVSTSITDVVRPYGENKLVEVADEPTDFVEALERLLKPESEEEKQQRLKKADQFLSQSSWDETWSDMESLILDAAKQRKEHKQIDEDRLQVSAD
jgi:UDP-galactopyranose mutase